MRKLTRLVNYIRANMILYDSPQHKLSDGHVMVTERYADGNGLEAEVTYWDGAPAVVTRPGFEEVTEGS